MEATKDVRKLEIKLKASDSAMEYKLWKKRLVRASKRYGWPLVELCPFLDELNKTVVDPVNVNEKEDVEKSKVLEECLRLYKYIVDSTWKAKIVRTVSKCIQSIAKGDEKLMREILDELNKAVVDPMNVKEKVQLQMVLEQLERLVPIKREKLKKVVYDEPKELSDEINYAMLNFITNSISNNLYMIVCDYDHDPVKLMAAINDNFNRATWARVVSLNNELRNLKLRDSESIASYYQRCLLIKHNLQELTGERNNISFVSHFLLGLPKDYDSPRNQILSRSNVDQRGFTNEELESIMNLIYQCEANVRVQREASNTILVTHAEGIKKKNRNKSRCYNCKVLGHGVDKCPLPIVKCLACKFIGHTESECRKSKKQKENAVLFTSVNLFHTKVNKPDRWVIDCGATTHITNDVNDIKDKENEMVYVNTVNTTGAPIQTITGTLKGKIGGRCIYLKNATHKLLAMSPMIENGWTFSIGNDLCNGTNKKGDSLDFVLNNGLYVRESVTCFNTIEHMDPYIVHCALGHASAKKIRSTLPDRTRSWEKDISFSDCETCMMAKNDEDKSKSPRFYSSEQRGI